MELQEFITNTLVEIQAGVQGAIDHAIKNNMKGAINPFWGSAKNIDPSLIEKVQFDVAVTASDKTAGSAGAGIKVVGVKLGGDLSGATEKSNISRIQFSIPIIPPVTTVTG